MKYEPLTSDSFFHIYNCGNNKEDIFVEERNYQYFLQLIKKYVIPVADVWSYCLLKNHFHLLIKTKGSLEDNIFSKAFSNLFNAYSKAINKAYQRSGSLFRDRFSRIKIHDEIYLKSLIIYINSNAVHHGFAVKVEDYKHCSYFALISDKNTLLNRDEVIALFDSKKNFRVVIKQKKDIIEELALE
jgi:REP element-mobilizing transposase RayT